MSVLPWLKFGSYKGISSRRQCLGATVSRSDGRCIKVRVEEMRVVSQVREVSGVARSARERKGRVVRRPKGRTQFGFADQISLARSPDERDS